MDYEDVKEKYDNGTVAKYDLITAEVAMNNAAPAMYDAQNNIVLCKWRLKALMGIDLDTEVNCVGSLSDYSDTMRELSMNVGDFFGKQLVVETIGVAAGEPA